MSETTMYGYKDGKLELVDEFGNSWGAAAFVWNALSKEMFGESASWMMRPEGAKQIWNLVDDESRSDWLRATVAFTLDRFMVQRENFERLANHLDKFVEHYPPDGVVCHLPAIAKRLREMDHDLACWWQTSVSDDPWYTWDKETREHKPYDPDEGDHTFIYEVINGTKKDPD